jgi:HSP20 family molecular chaperone IbpA
MEGSNVHPFLPDPPDPERWVPKTDSYISEEGHLVVEVGLAAIKKEDLELTVAANRLIIRGERSDGGRRQRCQYLVKELRDGPFENVIDIPPDYDLAQARAAYQNGIFQIDVPRGPEPRL